MSRRPVEWAGKHFNQVGLPTVAGTEADIPIVDADESGPGDFSFEHYTRPTIIRIVGRLTVQLNQTGSSVDNYSYRYLMGFMCADEDKPPGRLDEEFGHSWMWMTAGTVFRPKVQTLIPIGNAAGSQAVQINYFGSPLLAHEFDVRTMRKVGRDCELRLVLHCVSISSATVAPHITGFVRCLIKE